MTTNLLLLSHELVVAAIEARGGRLVASFELDAHGRTEGAPRRIYRPRRCGACGRLGHDLKRCTGEHSEPRPKYTPRRERTIETARDELARRIARRK